MNSGKYDRLATIEYPVTTTNPETGVDTTDWEPLMPLPGSPVIGDRVRGQLLDLLPSRSESVRTGLPVARNQSRWRQRWIDLDALGAALTPAVSPLAMRLVIHGDTDVVYGIVAGPAMIGRREELELVLERWSS